MAAAIRQCDELRADDCRRAAEERFSGEIMVRRYLALYRRLAAPRRTRTVVSLHAVGQLESLRREWTALCREDPHATPFQYPQWLIPWCRHLNSGRVAGAALRTTGALRAVALAIRENGIVRLLGDGVSDYLGIAAQSSADAREVLAPVLDGARAAEFVHLPSGSALLSAALGRTREEACVAQDLCPVLSLAPFEGPSDHWKLFRYLQRRLARTGRLETVDATSEALEPMLGDLFRLHAARWNGRGVLRGLESFHAEVALGFLREGMLRLTVLRLDGRAIAAVYAFATRGRTWFYLSGFDPRFERLSPGTVAVGTAIDVAAAEGHASFDFLRGAEPYKYWWGAKDTATFRRSLILG
jgi:CelD/BcsL family acetyltransferase involved in cellulose biosynthesis